MKRLILALLLIPIFAHSQTPQSERWKLLFEDKSKTSKTYIDTQTIEHHDYFHGHKNVYSLWTKAYNDFSNGKYHEEDVSHMVVDMDLKQFGIKSVTANKDDTNLGSQQFELIEWKDIPPESNGEVLLNYLKTWHK